MHVQLKFSKNMSLMVYTKRKCFIKKQMYPNLSNMDANISKKSKNGLSSAELF